MGLLSMTNLCLRNFLLCVAAMPMLLAGAAWAEAEPPARAGRITHIDGKVSFYADRDEGWQEALLNFPVTSENSIWTEGASRAEVRFGATAIRFNDDTVFDFVRLIDDATEGFLQRGSIQIRTRDHGRVDYLDSLSIDTADGRITFDGGGRYRLDAATDGAETRVSVFSGRARFERGDTRIGIDAGKQLVVRRVGSGVDFRFEIAAETGFDRWADARDQQWDRIHTRYVAESVVSPYMTGYEDLDTYGEWRDESEYGRVWYPRVVVADWAPYRYGRWSYVRPWGWTWIDDASWGFAPFHYGRWVQVRDRWCWWPGTYVARPVYAPALVAWYGRPGVGISISNGPAVGWFPLGPREHYVPHYTNNNAYIRRLNHISGNNAVVRPPVNYRNHVQGATFVQNNIFVNGNRVGGNLTRVDPRTLAGQGTSTHIGLQPGNRNRDNRDNRQMPDRAQGNQSPSPQFTRPAVQPPVGSPPAVNRPPRDKLRPEPSTGGPMPVPGQNPNPQPKPNYAPQPNRGGAYPVPAPSAGQQQVQPQSQPQAQPQVPPAEPRQPRQRPQYTSPPVQASPSPAPQAAPAAPAYMPDRDARSRPPRSQRPQTEPGSVTPVAPPVQQAPRRPVEPSPPRVAPPSAPRVAPPSAPVAPPAAPPAAQHKPPAEPSNKPRHEQQSNDNPPRSDGRRPAVLPN